MRLLMRPAFNETTCNFYVRGKRLLKVYSLVRTGLAGLDATVLPYLNGLPEM